MLVTFYYFRLEVIWPSYDTTICGLRNIFSTEVSELVDQVCDVNLGSYNFGHRFLIRRCDWFL